MGKIGFYENCFKLCSQIKQCRLRYLPGAQNLTELGNKENAPQIMAWDTTDNSPADLKAILDISDFPERGLEVSTAICTLKPAVKTTARDAKASSDVHPLYPARVLQV